MRKKTFPVLLVILIVVSLLLVGWTRTNPQRKTWEYKVWGVSKSSTSYSDIEKELNHLGAEGWELMFALPVGETSIYGPYYFKRAK